MAVSPNERPSLLTLPREIRDQIWQMLFIDSPDHDAHEDINHAHSCLGISSYPTMDGPYHLICRQLATEHTENLQTSSSKRRLIFILVNWPNYDVVQADIKKSLTYPSIDGITILIRPLLFTNTRQNAPLTNWTACCIHALRDCLDLSNPDPEVVEVKIWLDQQMDKGDTTTSLATSCSMIIDPQTLRLSDGMTHVYHEWRTVRRAHEEISQRRPGDLERDHVERGLQSFVRLKSVYRFRGESVAKYREAFDDLRFNMWDHRVRQRRPILTAEDRHKWRNRW